MTSRSHAHGLCGPGCGYKGLYEGSQDSLSDMASKQAAALGRVARLRQGIILELKQAFPVEFADAERGLGKRMSALDDEVLLAYLSGFLAMPKAQTAIRAAFSSPLQESPAATEELRAALAAAGVTVPASTDLGQWAAAVSSWASTMMPPQVAAVPATAPGKAPEVRVSSARLDVTDPEMPTPLDVVQHDDEIPWESLFSEEPPAEYGTGQDAPAVDPDLGPDLGPFAEPPPEAYDAVSGAADGHVPAAHGDVDLLSGLFDEPPPDDDPAPAPTEPALPVTEALPDEPPLPEVAPSAPAPAPEPGAPVNTRTSGPLKPVAPGGAPASVRPAGRTRKAPPKGRGRKPRVSAAGPGALSDPVEALAAAAAESGGTISDALRDKFLAVVCMPRPVFVSDLVEMVGDADLVAAWESEYRSMGAAGPLRFIAAKQRHKDRGALILPFSEELRTATDGFEKSLWARCINAPNLKGAKLYELAVVLHRVIDQVVTCDIGTLTVSMRINQQRGLVGLVLVLDPETGPGSPAREELGAGMRGLAEGRLGLLAVCTYAGGNRSVPDLAQSAREEIDRLGLDPTFPVIAQHSWSFASDGGTSAVSVL